MNQFSLYSDVKTRLSAKKGVFFYIYKNIEKNRLETTLYKNLIKQNNCYFIILVLTGFG